MGIEIDLLAGYPRVYRDLDGRQRAKSEEVRLVAREFGREYFDGDRAYGYGGFRYDPRFWEPVIPSFVSHFGLTSDSSILDVGCAKGFMLYDFGRQVPGIKLSGIDVSDYAIQNALPEMSGFLQVGNARSLPFPDNSFDVVLSINTIHNLDREDCATALSEIERVARHGAFVTVDAYRNEEERRRMERWNLTALTMMATTEWERFFVESGYTGDYFWFIP